MDRAWYMVQRKTMEMIVKLAGRQEVVEGGNVFTCLVAVKA